VKTRTSFESFILGLPATTLVEQWEASVAKVGGKVFALFGLDSRGIVFKVGEIAFAGLTSLEGIAQAPYFARGAWVVVRPGALPVRDLKAYVAESHRMVAAKLTRKLRAELGLS
jgi:predicted DNA-binding protein (MmcQ/YjbR family)